MKPSIEIPFCIGRVALRRTWTGIVALSALAAPTFAQVPQATSEPKTAEPGAQFPAPKGPEVKQELLNALMLPVSVRLNNATVKQMAEAISKVSKLSIRVDDSVSDTVRITLEAHRIPVATLLAAMARRAELLIARDKNPVGVLLTHPPMLKMDETPLLINASPTYPWTEDWGIPPSDIVSLQSGRTADNYSSLPSTGIPSGFTTSEGLSSNTTPFTVFNASSAVNPAGGNQYQLTNTQASNLTYTSVGDSLLVVSEPGRGEKGESGVWLTVYRIEKSGSIGKVGTLFHAYKENSVSNIFLNTPVRPGSAPTPTPGTDPTAAPEAATPPPQLTPKF